MRIAVFGASGVIGSALVPRLAEAHEVVALSRRARDDGDVRGLSPTRPTRRRSASWME